jgi:hypothetical protein
MSTTIRKNARKKIGAILDAAVLIREVRIDDMTDTNETVTPAVVMCCLHDADRVYLDAAGTLHIVDHRNHFWTAYPSVEVARQQLTTPAFTKYFPDAAPGA